MNARQSARLLGRRGGLARARRLSPLQRRRIASLGGFARGLSSKAAERIEDNLRYLKVIQELQKPPPVKAVSHLAHPLPDIHPQKGFSNRHGNSARPS